MPEPDTPVTVVNTPNGKATSSSCRLLRVTPVRRSQPLGARGVRAGGCVEAEQVTPRLRFLDVLEPFGRTAVEHPAAVLARAGADVDDPVGVPHHVEIVLDDEQRVARGLQPVERRQQRFGVDRMQTGGRLVEHVDDAEQVRAHLRRQPKPLQFARRQRGRAALERQVAEPEVEQHGEARLEVLGDPLRDDHLLRMLRLRIFASSALAPSAYGRKIAASLLSGSLDMSAMSRPANVTDSDSRRRRLPWQTGHSVLSM